VNLAFKGGDMGALKDKLLEAEIRPKLVVDCVQLVDNEVASKKGISGMMIKTGYKAFKAIKPNIVKDAVKYLLDDFVKALDVRYDQYTESDETSFEGWAVPRDKEIANDLLGITDAIIAKSQKKALAKIYHGLRKVAERNVAQAVPAIGRLVDKYMR
jgi:hypothetical protein